MVILSCLYLEAGFIRKDTAEKSLKLSLRDWAGVAGIITGALLYIIFEIMDA